MILTDCVDFIEYKEICGPKVLYVASKKIIILMGGLDVNSDKIMVGFGYTGWIKINGPKYDMML